MQPLTLAAEQFRLWLPEMERVLRIGSAPGLLAVVASGLAAAGVTVKQRGSHCTFDVPTGEIPFGAVRATLLADKGRRVLILSFDVGDAHSQLLWLRADRPGCASLVGQALLDSPPASRARRAGARFSSRRLQARDGAIATLLRGGPPSATRWLDRVISRTGIEIPSNGASFLTVGCGPVVVGLFVRADRDGEPEIVGESLAQRATS